MGQRMCGLTTYPPRWSKFNQISNDGASVFKLQAKLISTL